MAAVATNEIKTGTEFDDLAESELMTWLQQGTVFKKFNHGWATAQPHHQCRVWIRGSSLCYGNLQAREVRPTRPGKPTLILTLTLPYLQARGRREKTVALDEIEECIVGAGSDVFRRNWISDQVLSAAIRAAAFCACRPVDTRVLHACGAAVFGRLALLLARLWRAHP